MSPVALVRMTSAKVERSVVVLTSFVLSSTILRAFVAFAFPPSLEAVRDSGRTVRKVASTRDIQNETVNAATRLT